MISLTSTSLGLSRVSTIGLVVTTVVTALEVVVIVVLGILGVFSTIGCGVDPHAEPCVSAKAASTDSDDQLVSKNAIGSIVLVVIYHLHSAELTIS